MEERSITLLDFASLLFAISLPVLLFALFTVTPMLRRFTSSWLRIGLLVALWIFMNFLATTVLWLVAGYLELSFGNSFLNFLWPILITALITTAPIFLLRRKEALTSHLRDKA